MQELELNYPPTKTKVFSEEEDRYLLCRLNHYGIRTEDVYERIKRDVSEFPVFRFDWFLKSRSPQELQRRCHTLLGMLEKEAAEQLAAAQPKGKVSALLVYTLPPLTLIQKRNYEETKEVAKPKRPAKKRKA